MSFYLLLALFISHAHSKELDPRLLPQPLLQSVLESPVSPAVSCVDVEKDIVSKSNVKAINETDAPNRVEDKLKSKFDLTASLKVKDYKGKASEAINVFQETFGYLTPESSYKYIGSKGAYPCINVFLIDSTTGKAVIGHFDQLVNAEAATKKMIENFPGGNFRPNRVVLSSEEASLVILNRIMSSSVVSSISKVEYIKSNALYVDKRGDVYANPLISSDAEKRGYAERTGLMLLPGPSCEKELLKDILQKAGPLKECPGT